MIVDVVTQSSNLLEPFTSTVTAAAPRRRCHCFCHDIHERFGTHACDSHVAVEAVELCAAFRRQRVQKAATNGTARTGAGGAANQKRIRPGCWCSSRP